MLDQFGRNINYLRVSVTDRCDLRCIYCMPKEGISWTDPSHILRYEEMVRLCRLFAGLGITKIRLTGGEPLVRRDLQELVRGIGAIEGIDKLNLTTNGVKLSAMLPQLVEAGLGGINLSLDTLDREQFYSITRIDALHSVLDGLMAAINEPNLSVKLNCVPMEQNESQLVPLARLAKEHDIAVRFIELMPIGLGSNLNRRTEDEVRAVLEEAFGKARVADKGDGAGPGRYVTFDGFCGKVGFISAMTHQFCDGCNRVRLTATGFLKTCLQYDEGVNLGELIRRGATDAMLLNAMEEAITGKPASHQFSSANVLGGERKMMHQIGG